MRVLLVSGSSREGSTNAAVPAHGGRRGAGANVETVLYPGIGELPIFSPDDDREGLQSFSASPAMSAARSRRATPCSSARRSSRARMPAALKNLLEWTIGDAGTYQKPVAWINAAGAAAPTGAADAHKSLRKVLGYAGADIVEHACARIPVERALVGEGRPDHRRRADAARRSPTAVATLAAHAATAREA